MERSQETTATMSRWTIEDAAELYRIRDWGAGFFSINEAGNVQIDPHQDGRFIDLKDLVDDIQRKTRLSLPILIRFSNILQRRIEELHRCFDNAIRQRGYRGRYYGVYPIKVNQQRQVVEEIVKFGRPFDLGLEAGSKPELHAVLALMDNPNALIICNGYKDEDYITMALIGQKLERKILIVVEKLAELPLIFRLSRDLGVHPQIGLRVKLTASGAGRWESSGGEFSKFGLTAAEIMQGLDWAEKEGLLDSIQLLHFHLGSQITDIASVREALREISRFYASLTQAGCEIQYIDVGGGLGVDYDGSRSSGPSSANYTPQDYADAIISAMSDICREADLPQPHVITESGRALTAFHSMMVLDVIEATTPPAWDNMPAPKGGDSEALAALHDILDSLRPENAEASWIEAQRWKFSVLEDFKRGSVGIVERAAAERLYWTIARQLYRIWAAPGTSSPEADNLKQQVCDKYFCNFSVFQSVPDSWAIDQIFPVMPIHRLNEAPTKEATLQDITCDSDGNLDHFIGGRNFSPVLTVHDFRPDETYLLGVFLVGAYQEILGDLHNLFGDTNAVHVSLLEDGSYRFEEVIQGEDVRDVLEYVQFDASDLLERLSRMLGIGLGKGTIQPEDAEEMMALYRHGLQGYTYLIAGHESSPEE